MAERPTRTIAVIFEAEMTVHMYVPYTSDDVRELIQEQLYESDAPPVLVKEVLAADGAIDL